MRIEDIRKKARQRPVGYFEDVLSKGIIIGDYLEITPADYALLIDKYQPKEQSQPKKSCCGRR